MEKEKKERMAKDEKETGRVSIRESKRVRKIDDVEMLVSEKGKIS